MKRDHELASSTPISTLRFPFSRLPNSLSYSSQSFSIQPHHQSRFRHFVLVPLFKMYVSSNWLINELSAINQPSQCVCKTRKNEQGLQKWRKFGLLYVLYGRTNMTNMTNIIKISIPPLLPYSTPVLRPANPKSHIPFVSTAPSLAKGSQSSFTPRNGEPLMRNLPAPIVRRDQ